MSSIQSALAPAGPLAERLTEIIWIFTAVCGAVWILVMMALLAALLRRRAEESEPLLETDPMRDRRYLRVAGGAVAATVLVLFGLTLISFLTSRSIAGTGRPALTIEVTGHQWWWEIRYVDETPSRSFTTANEIHIPVGKTVRLKLRSSDVIHSFWVPKLMGKRDLITGRENALDLVAGEAGTYRGQCAEFCGLEHARMSILVIAEPDAAFERWYEHQLEPAEPASDALRAKGQSLFQTRSCVLCHAVRGTEAGGKVAPDLTHLASRQTIAAGTLPMRRGALQGWIADPQTVKPGAHMPMTALSPDELVALGAYLAGLK